MKAGDIMTAGAATIGAEASVADAAQMMVRHRISGLPVVDADGQLIGVVTERDLLRRAELGTERQRPRWFDLWVMPGDAADDYVHAHGRSVRDVMSRQVVSVAAETPLEEVVSIMEKRGFKRLPVLRDGRIVGIVSRANFLVALAHRLSDDEPPAADDLAVRRMILDEIEDQTWSGLAMVDVEVVAGAVSLRGTVTDERVRRAVVVAAQTAAGTRPVTDSLTVVPFTPIGV
ncbi:CBS domain-containing protein [Aquibium carbonis]|uniref:CBS domain-containing protein n=1 Tax=Aquibium carbonis TaxID=2495581 RepID=A0A3S0ASJ7_9HYPH|nr:CBS domain-containing protein [Aquibium carbonis]RST86096.1 CBS domain-containing protein [Aquibium carbonis]